MEYVADVQSLLQNAMYIEQKSDLSYTIGVRIPEIIDEKIRELVEFCFHTAKQYAFG